jgi:hypothetical protein
MLIIIVNADTDTNSKDGSIVSGIRTMDQQQHLCSFIGP